MHGIEGGRVLVDKPLQAYPDKSSRRSGCETVKLKPRVYSNYKESLQCTDASLSMAEYFTGRFTMG